DSRGLLDVATDSVTERLDDAAESRFGLPEQISRQGGRVLGQGSQLGQQALGHPALVPAGLRCQVALPGPEFGSQGCRHSLLQRRPACEEEVGKRWPGALSYSVLGEPEFVPDDGRVDRLGEYRCP